MKKSKCILAMLTATVFATSVGALVACGGSDDSKPDGGVYEVTFDANGGAYADGNSVKLNTVGGKILSAPTAPEREGFVFNGYNVMRDGTGANITFGSDGYSFKGATTVYAQWTDEGTDGVYTVTFDGNGGTIIGGNKLQTSNGKLSSLIAETYLSYPDHTFGGWYTSATGGERVTTEYVFSADATVYAHWTANGGGEVTEGVYTITFDANGGTLAGSSTAQTANGLLSTLPVPTLPNHTFDGWYTSITGGVKVTTAHEFTGDATLYAHWTVNGGATEEIGYYIIGTKKAELINNGKPAFDTAEKEFCALGVELEGGAAVSFEIDGEPLEFIMDSRSHGAKKVGNTLVAKAAGGTYDIYVRYYAATATDEATWTVEMNDGLVEEKQAYYLVGDVNGWALDSEYKFVEAALADDETHLSKKYKLAGVEIAANTEFKVKYNPAEGENELWYAGLETDYVDATIATGGGYGDNAANIKVVTAGKYDIYLKFGTDGIHSIYIGLAGSEGSGGGGDVVDNGTASFTVGNGAAISLTNNSANIPPEHKAQREFMKEGVALAADDIVKFTVDGEELTVFNLAGESHGVTLTAGGLKVLEAGTFNIYVRFYKADNEEPRDRWVIEMTDGKDEEVGTLIEGDYYIVGSMNGWAPKEAYHIGANGATLKLFEGQAFKVAKNKAGGPDWTATHFVYSNVSVGKGYIDTDADNNICIKATATYTIKINGGKIEITSTEIEEPEIPVIASTFYLKGTVDGVNKWGSEEYNLSEVTPTDGAKKQYSITITITSAIEFKIYNSANDGWYNNIHGGSDVMPTGNDNKTITGAGTYTFIVQ
ncbi:MAG: InlB B-repeat-containing protein, partial [Clostridiales bacterium]|nr:InlB B-repeat-containing protein [Clostridiales bacterium]